MSKQPETRVYQGGEEILERIDARLRILQPVEAPFLREIVEELATKPVLLLTSIPMRGLSARLVSTPGESLGFADSEIHLSDEGVDRIIAACIQSAKDDLAAVHPNVEIAIAALRDAPEACAQTMRALRATLLDQLQYQSQIASGDLLRFHEDTSRRYQKAIWHRQQLAKRLQALDRLDMLGEGYESALEAVIAASGESIPELGRKEVLGGATMEMQGLQASGATINAEATAPLLLKRHARHYLACRQLSRSGKPDYDPEAPAYIGMEGIHANLASYFRDLQAANPDLFFPDSAIGFALGREESLLEEDREEEKSGVPGERHLSAPGLIRVAGAALTASIAEQKRLVEPKFCSYLDMFGAPRTVEALRDALRDEFIRNGSMRRDYDPAALDNGDERRSTDLPAGSHKRQPDAIRFDQKTRSMVQKAAGSLRSALGEGMRDLVYTARVTGPGIGR